MGEKDLHIAIRVSYVSVLENKVKLRKVFTKSGDDSLVFLELIRRVEVSEGHEGERKRALQ